MFNFKNLRSANSIPLSSDYEMINFNNRIDTDNQYISAVSALTNSDIYSVISQLSADLANCTFTASQPKAQALIDNPTTTANAKGFWSGMFAQLLLDGNAYAYRWRNKNGVDKRLEYLRPSQVQVMLLEDGTGLTYNINFDEPDIGFMENVPSSDMIHFRLTSRNGGKTGISPLSALANEVSIKNESNKLTMSALNHAIDSPGILTVQKGGKLNAKQKSAHSRSFSSQIKHNNGGPIVLDDLETYTPLEIKSDVAKLLEQSNWTSTQIAKVYGIPDSYVNGKGDQQSSLKMIQGFYSNALNRYAQAIASELDNKLSADIKVNIRTATDPNGDIFATILGEFAKDKILTNAQAIEMLKDMDYFPMEVPKAENGNVTASTEGGDD